MQFIKDNYKTIFEIIGFINVAVTFLALITPSNQKKTILGYIGRFFDRIGINLK